MSFLDEYKNLTNEETDNQFPEEMQHDGLTENDRELYEEVLKNMREEMNKANEEMKKKSSSWDNSKFVQDGTIKNTTYKLNEEMLRNKLASTSPNGGNAKPVFEPIGLMIEGYRCPQCGMLMYDGQEGMVCSNCGYTEVTGKGTRFVILDSTYNKIPMPKEYNDVLVEIFRQANKTRQR